MSQENKDYPNCRPGIGYVLLVCFLLPLAAHAHIGSFSRFLADDYCSAATARSHGVLWGAAYWYVKWTGRFSANLLDSVMGYAGPGITPYVAPSAILVWLAVLLFAICQLSLANHKLARFKIAGLIAALVLFATFEIAPTVAQSLYWGQGMRSVIPPLILGTAYAGLVQYRRKRPERFPMLWIVISAGMTFTAGGFSETYALLQTAALVILLFLVLATHSVIDRRNLLPLITAGLMGSLMAMGTVAAAPGNLNRQTLYPLSPGLQELLQITSSSFLDFWATILLSGWRLLSLLVLVAVSAMIGSGIIFGNVPIGISRRERLRIFVALPPVTLALLLSCFVPAAYAMSSAPPGRTLIIPSFVLVSVLAAWGYIGGQLTHERVNMQKLRRSKRWWTVAELCMLLLPVSSVAYATHEILSLRPVVSAFAAEWDKTDEMIRSAKSTGRARLNIEPLRNWAELGPLASPEPFNSWISRCASNYYGLTIAPIHSGK